MDPHMNIEIQLTDSPIVLRPAHPVTGAQGACVEFHGVVRGEENGQPIAALEYEAYRPMARVQIQRLLETLAARQARVPRCLRDSSPGGGARG
jgi:molybdopterin synthase catalytic subunit